jgi:hypothetical protein
MIEAILGSITAVILYGVVFVVCAYLHKKGW